MSVVVARARELIGTRFRPQGRSASEGVDCVGLALLAFGLPRDLGRRDYRMRGGDKAELFAALGGGFRRVARTRVRVGDLIVMRTGPGQLHLGIRSEAGMIHADAVLRKVVERPGDLPWAVVAVFRRRVRV
nr:peptidoglycan endopeptidase [uncultured Sphingomonas sp.]